MATQGEDTGSKLPLPASAHSVTDMKAPDETQVETDLNVSEDPSNKSEENPDVGDLDAQALKQIEFYFSDANLPYDKFMWTLHTKHADHWVPLSTIVGFRRMLEFKPLGVPHMAELIRKSPSKLLEVDSEGVNIRRVKVLTPPTESQFDRSVYAKGFGEATPDLQKKLEHFFEQYGPINAVRMRRKDKKRDGSNDFKGSAFCEYQTQEGAEAFLNAVPTPKWGDAELLIMSKDDYVTMKAREKGFAVPDRKKVLVGNKSRSFNAFKLMEQDPKLKAQARTGDEDEADEPKTIYMDGRTYTIREDGTVNPEDLANIESGKVLQWSGAGEGRDPFAIIKDALKSAFPKPPYVKTLEGGSGYAGFSHVLTDEQIETVRTKVPQIHDQDVTWEKLSEDGERAYWSTRANELAKQVVDGKSDNKSGGQKKGFSGGRGRGGVRGRGRGRGGGSRGGARGGDGKRKRDDNGTKESEGADTASKGGVPVIGTAKKAKVA